MAGGSSFPLASQASGGGTQQSQQTSPSKRRKATTRPRAKQKAQPGASDPIELSDSDDEDAGGDDVIDGEGTTSWDLDHCPCNSVHRHKDNFENLNAS